MNQNSSRTAPAFKLFVLLFWLVVWEVAALLVNTPLLLPGIGTTLRALLELITQVSFYTSLTGTLLRFAQAVLLSSLLGIAAGILSGIFPFLEEILNPFVITIRSLPVVSVSVLLNLWLQSNLVPLAVSFFVCFPITWTNVLSGFRSTNVELIEMANLYSVPWGRKIKDLYLPSLKPFITSSLISSIGLGWKSTITAEVLASVIGSVGMNLYYDKLYLQTPQLFAWTLVLILTSYLMEALIRFVLKISDGRRKEA